MGKDECRLGIDFLSDDIGRRLRAMGMKCGTVQLTIKDEYLRSVQRQRPQNPPSDISREIADTAYRILLDEWNERKPIRMITVTASSLVRAELACEQLDIFGASDFESRSTSKKREETIDKIRQKHGNAAIVQGAVLDSDLGIYGSDEHIPPPHNTIK